MVRVRGCAGASWRGMRLPQRLQEGLRQRHALRLHGWCIGSLILGVMWAVSHAQMALGMPSLALRYLVTLGVGYGVYLLVLRLWAAWLLRRRSDAGDAPDGLDLLPDAGWPAGPGPQGPAPPLHGGGGDFGGAGATGQWDAPAADGVGGTGWGGDLGDAASGALEAAGSADEAAVVVVPVVAIFVVGVALLGGGGCAGVAVLWQRGAAGCGRRTGVLRGLGTGADGRGARGLAWRGLAPDGQALAWRPAVRGGPGRGAGPLAAAGALAATRGATAAGPLTLPLAGPCGPCGMPW